MMLTLNDGRTELWQWDTGRTLSVDADCSQVHFSNKVFGRSIDVDVVSGVAIIPDVLLQVDKELTAWAFVGPAADGYTKISKTFKVNRRNKPADYVFTPVEQTTISEIKAIAQSVRDDANAGKFNGKDGVDGYTPVCGKDYWTEADKQDMTAAVLGLVNEDLDEIRSEIADMKYVPIDITKISNNVGTVEKGVTVNEMTVSWTLNKAPVSQTLAGEAVDASVRSKTVNMEGKTSVSLSVTDERGSKDSASTGYNSYNGVYYGVMADGTTIDSDAILALTKKIQSGRGVTFTVNFGTGARIAFAIPTDYGSPIFKDAATGFGVDMTLVKENFSFTNAHGYTTNYNVWLSTNILKNSLTVVVS